MELVADAKTCSTNVVTGAAGSGLSHSVSPASQRITCAHLPSANRPYTRSRRGRNHASLETAATQKLDWTLSLLVRLVQLLMSLEVLDVVLASQDTTTPFSASTDTFRSTNVMFRRLEHTLVIKHVHPVDLCILRCERTFSHHVLSLSKPWDPSIHTFSFPLGYFVVALIPALNIATLSSMQLQLGCGSFIASSV